MYFYRSAVLITGSTMAGKAGEGNGSSMGLTTGTKGNTHAAVVKGNYMIWRGPATVLSP